MKPTKAIQAARETASAPPTPDKSTARPWHIDDHLTNDYGIPIFSGDVPTHNGNKPGHDIVANAFKIENARLIVEAVNEREAIEKANRDLFKKWGELATDNATLRAENERLKGAGEKLLNALRLNWTHTDDRGITFWCNCPRFAVLTNDCSKDKDSDHATGCREARAALKDAKP